jgi:hypothetical protein
MDLLIATCPALMNTNFLRIITAMRNAEINTGHFQKRRKGFHYYYFFLWRSKTYSSRIDTLRYWGMKISSRFVAKEVKI